MPLILIVLAAVPSFCRADDIADYLQQHGLKRLLAAHLEQQLETAKADERGDLAVRLAALYAELLDSASDPATRQQLEERSRRLLEQAPANSAEELRLALLRITYRAAEKTAENHRLRLASLEEIDAAKKSLAEILPQLNAVRLRLKFEVESSDRRLARAAGSTAAAIGQVGEHTRNLFSQATFLHAWALFYDAWLNQRPESAREAETLLASLLQTDSPYPQPSEVSVDLRANEAVARSILGMALCKSITASSTTAIGWLDLLQHENAFELLREQAPIWKIAVYLEHREYQHVREMLQHFQQIREGQAPKPMPLSVLRLVAVYALEEGQRSRQAEDLARLAVFAMAAQGELQQVLDLANRYGVESLGNSGFALQYVRGVLKYQAARAAHGSEMPTLDPQIQQLYAAAAEQLTAATNEPDAKTAGRLPSSTGTSPLVACKRLIAWSLYFQSRYLDAKDAFTVVAAELTGNDAAESMWMAIVCVDKLVETSNDPLSQTQLVEMTQRFLDQFPSHERAPLLRLRMSIAAETPSEEAADELLRIPSNSEVYDAAQRRAADMLYRLFREARGDERFYLANRFLSVAVGLLGEAARTAELATPHGDERLVVRCRQVLEVALAEGIDRVRAAQEAFAALAAITTDHDLSAYADELDCRRVQMRLLEQDSQAAGLLSDELWARNPTSTWTRLATRAMFKFGHGLWKSGDSTEDDKKQGIELVIRFGGRVLYEFRESPAAAGAAAYQVAVAEASMAHWEQTGDTEKGKAALFLFDKLLAARPRSAPFLRSTALLAEALGDPEKAMDCWRRLAAGSEPRSEAWYEARYHLVKILANRDPAKAREVMDQHKTLNPDYGPEPWGGMLKGLDAQIPANIAAP